MSEKSVAQINQEILDTLFEIRQMEKHEKQAQDTGPDSIMDLIDRLSGNIRR